MALGFAISCLSKNPVKDIRRALSLRNQGLPYVQNPILAEQLLKNPDLIYFFKLCEFPARSFVFNNRG